MKTCVIIVLLWIMDCSKENLFVASQGSDDLCVSEKSVSRKRRYLTFPDASSLQLVYCLTMPSLGVGGIFTYGITAGTAWELPAEAQKVLEIFGIRKPTTTTTTTEAPTTTVATLPTLVYDEDPDHTTASSDDQKDSSKNASRRIYYQPNYIHDDWWDKYKYRAPTKNYYNPIPTYREEFQFPQRDNSFKNYFSPHQVDQSEFYNHPSYHKLHRRTRRDLYKKIQDLFTALNKTGESCLLKAICEVSQKSDKGTFMEEIIKTIFRIKPHDNYANEDQYDEAADKNHNCVEKFKSCKHSVWLDMF